MVSLNKIKTGIKSSGIYQYNSILNKIKNKKIKPGDIAIKIGTPYGRNYGGFKKGTFRAYVWEGEDRFSLLFSDISRQRANQAIKHFGDYKMGKVNPLIYHNYITGGYNTRAGILRTKTGKINRIKNVALSHANYLGQETGNSLKDHDNRKLLRPI